jgi:microcystin degradation protein MlrC
MGLRIAVGGFLHESHSFAPQPTGWEDFRRPGDGPTPARGAGLIDALRDTSSGIAGAIAAIEAAGAVPVPLLWCAATPAGPVTDEAFERIAAQLCAALSDALAAAALDGIYLDLHGAAIADSAPDAEGELLRRVRAVAGDLPLVISLDPHANLTAAMVARCDAVAPYRTYPHVDMRETGARAVALLLARIGRGAPFAKAYRQIDFLIPITSQCTLDGPMRAVMERRAAIESGMGVAPASMAPAGNAAAGGAHAGEAYAGEAYAGEAHAGKPRVRGAGTGEAQAGQAWALDGGAGEASAGEARGGEAAAPAAPGAVAELAWCFGFPYADFAGCGPAIAAYGESQPAAEAAADALAALIEGMAGAFALDVIPAGQAVEHALAQAGRAPGGPVVIADTQDNPGGGGHGDTTGLLRCLVEQGAAGAVLCVLNDAASAAACHAAGEGAELALSLGGRSDGAPLAARARVLRLTDGRFTLTGPMGRGNPVDLGPTALIEIPPGVQVMVASRKVQVYDQAIPRHVGIEPAATRILALKSSVHFRADFTAFASLILVAAAPGPVVADPATLPFRHLRPGLRLRPV